MANELATVKTGEMGIDEAIREGVKIYGIIATFDVDSEEARVELYRAQNNAESLATTEGAPITICNVAFMDGNDYITEDEESTIVEPHPSVILFTTDGKCYYSSSKGVYESVKTIISTFGMPREWEQPKTVVLKTRQTRNGRSYKYLEM